MPSSQRRLSIAFVNDNFRHGGVGGVVSAWRFVERLRERHQVILIGTDADGIGKVPVLDIPSRILREMGFVMARPDRAAIASAIAAADVVHVQLPFWLGFVALAEARRLGKPVVAGFHIQPENALFNVGIRATSLARLLYRFWIHYFYDRSDAVVAPSEFAASKLREHGLTRPIRVISNGVHPSASERPRFLRPTADPSAFRVLSVGRLAEEKHQETLIDAVQRSRFRNRIELVIAGRGPRERELRERAAALPNARVGFVSQEDLWRLLDTSDLFVHCSEVELEGMAVLEAMSAGLPVLVADGPETAASELALDDRFRFPVRDAEGLASKLDALLERPSELRIAGAQYRRMAAARDLGRSVDELVELYRALLEMRAPRVLGPALPAQAVVHP
ncbi:MAG TPA: glycosyltransferase [Polyangiaceae bacterium]|nr:glycosyltransferase [Polyangiaceae bacterium]